jgi:chromosome segregation protein
VRNFAADATAKLNAVRARAVRLGERTTVLQGELARLLDEQQRWHGERLDLTTRERLLGEREQQVLADLGHADGAAAAIGEQESALRREWTEVDGRRQALVAMESDYEGVDAGPRHVLQQRPAGLRGRLLDLIEIDLAHGPALEAALGPYVQALVVDTREHAAAIVRDLAERKLGRVLLLVEAAFGEAPPCGSRSSLLPPPAGVAYLTDLVRHVVRDGAIDAAASQRLLGWLLRGVVVADFDIADSSRADLCFVTSTGTLVCGPRMEGGATADGQAGLVVRRSRIVELGVAADALQVRLGALQVGREQATGRVDRLKRELKAVGDAHGVVRRALQHCEGQQTRLVARQQDVERELGELAQESSELVRTRCAALGRLGPALFDQFLLGRAESQAQAGEQSFGQRIVEAEAAAKAQQQAEQELRIQQAQTVEVREGLTRSIRLHEDGVRELARAIEEIAARSADAEDDRATALDAGEQSTETAAVLEDRLAELEQQKATADQALQAARSERAAVQQTVSQWEQRRSAANEALTQTKLVRADVEHRFSRLEDRLREDTGIELRRCLGEVHGIGLEDPARYHGPVAPLDVVLQLQGPPLPPDLVEAWYGLQRLWLRSDFDVEGARKDVQLLHSQKERLGAVNLDAVKELDAEEGQFTNLEQEVADLKEARRSLLEALRKLEAESKTLFEQTFHEARKNFQDIFRKLFQGGKADMFLSNMEDLLEAGIEIVAQPPGKQLQSINLLSGGERSLTAVAILFALFKVRPSPFCILDEVDAALDETNVERFLRVLRDFTAQTQFCIVTHHKRTMADCQVLYGITMQRRGVSSRIAVSLQEVDSFHAGAATTAAKPDPAQKQRIAGEEAVGFN